MDSGEHASFAWPHISARRPVDAFACRVTNSGAKKVTNSGSPALSMMMGRFRPESGANPRQIEGPHHLPAGLDHRECGRAQIANHLTDLVPNTGSSALLMITTLLGTGTTWRNPGKQGLPGQWVALDHQKCGRAQIPSNLTVMEYRNPCHPSLVPDQACRSDRAMGRKARQSTLIIRGFC